MVLVLNQELNQKTCSHCSGSGQFNVEAKYTIWTNGKPYEHVIIVMEPVK